jgi:kumamolisin
VAHAAPSARFTGNTPSDTHEQYDLTPLYARGINGSGQTIAIASFADYSESNVQTFDQQFSLPTANVSRVNVSAGGSSGSPLGVNNGQDEAEMDIEMVHATAPNAAILMYEAPNSDQGAVALWSRIVSDNRAKVVTTSWGGPEPMYPASELNAIHQLLQEGAAQGQAIFAASGDAGAYDETGVRHGNPNALVVDYPASDPYVTGVGGTSLQANGPQYAGETAWSDSSDTTGPAGSGGGLSQSFSRPSWQTGPGVNNQYSNGKRQVPDVSADADPSTGYAVYTIATRSGSSWGVVGGTSAASPVWAGFAALVNQSAGHPLGFLNPTLYRLGQLSASLPRAPYHDVTQGDNLYYPATAGWDFATGWGSFDGAAFVADLPSIGTVQSAPSPTPTQTPAPTSTPTPSVSVNQIVLLHTVKGKAVKTRALKVGEAGTLVILYTSKNKGALQTTGKVQIKQGGKVIKTVSLKAGTYAGKPALTATVRFTSAMRIGTLIANATVHLGSLSSALGYSFSVVKP